MPEGPEIRHHVKTLQPIVGKQLTSIHVLSGRYIKRAIENMGKPIGETIVSMERRGKLIVLNLEKWSIMLTAGMSGHWYEGSPDVQFKRIEIKADDSPFTFVDMRNFSTFKVVKPEVAQKKLKELGVDVFEDGRMIELRERLMRHGKHIPICEALLEQKIFAGVGNYIRAEAMYLAKIDPKQSATSLTDVELTDLWNAIRAVSDSAYILESNYKDVCYRREVAMCGRPVKNFTDNTGRTVWHV